MPINVVHTCTWVSVSERDQDCHGDGSCFCSTICYQLLPEIERLLRCLLISPSSLQPCWPCPNPKRETIGVSFLQQRPSFGRSHGVCCLSFLLLLSWLSSPRLIQIRNPSNFWVGKQGSNLFVQDWAKKESESLRIGSTKCLESWDATNVFSKTDQG